MAFDDELKRPFSASIWNEWCKRAMRWLPLHGVGADIQYTENGIVIGADAETFWRHPWTARLQWIINEEDPTDKGGWQAFIWPGFVNGRDVTITRPKTKDQPEKEVPLTDEEPAGLRMAWRNPLLPAGVGASLSGEIVFQPGEGYPKFFESIGVKPAAKGGVAGEEGAAESAVERGRTREIRACDIFLVTPRIASKQDVEVLAPTLDSQSIRITTSFVNTYYANAPSRYMLRAAPKWQPPTEPTALDRLMGTAVEPQTDEIKIMTVYMVSPPDWPAGEEPNEAWTAYPKYDVFWNLMHASKQLIGQNPNPPITLVTGLVGGLADSIFAGLLSRVNDAFAQIEAYLFASDFKGAYWNV